MKFIYTFILAVLVGFSALARTDYSINLTPASEEYSELTWTGFSTMVNLDDKIVKDVLKDRLKTFGKVQNQKKFWVVAPANISNLSTADVVVYYDKEGKDQTKIWMTVYQQGVFQEEVARTTLYNLVYEIYEKDLNEKLEEAQEEQEDLVKDADKIVKEIKDDEGDIKKEEKRLKKSEKEVNKLKRELEKAETNRDRTILNLESVSLDKKSDAQKDNEKAMEKVNKIQKDMVKEEEDQIKYAKDIRKNEDDIKKGKDDLKKNEKKQKENKEILDRLVESRKNLIRMRK